MTGVTFCYSSRFVIILDLCYSQSSV